MGAAEDFDLGSLAPVEDLSGGGGGAGESGAGLGLRIRRFDGFQGELPPGKAFGVAVEDPDLVFADGGGDVPGSSVSRVCCWGALFAVVRNASTTMLELATMASGT